jgi:hypothetical protein
MGTGTKIVTHAGMGMGTGIFSNCGYGDEDYSTLPIPYPLPSLFTEEKKKTNLFKIFMDFVCTAFV